MSAAVRQAISTKKIEIEAMIILSEEHCIARRPIDFDLEADIARAEAELAGMVALNHVEPEDLRAAA